MSKPDRPDILDWFGLRQPWVLTVARPLGVFLSVVVILLFGLAIVAAGAILLHAILDLGFDAPRAGFGTGAVIVALIGAPFVIWRSVALERQTRTAEQGHITDRINKAVEGLGAEKTVNRIGRPVLLRENDPDYGGMADVDLEERRTEIEWRGESLRIPVGLHVDEEYDWQAFTETQPNLEVRIGAIYALERIAQDSDRDHVQIMEILCAYIRQNAPAPDNDDWPELEMKEGEDDGPLEADWDERMQAFHEAQEERKKSLKLREDIQVALTVIGRRSEKQRRLEAGRGVEAEFPFDVPCPEFDGSEDGHDQAALDAYRKDFDDWRETLRAYTGYRLDLRGADLRGADLSSLVLNGAQLAGTYLHGAILKNAQLQGAFLMDARLPGATLMDARLQGANLIRARLQVANLIWARLQGANLMRARLQGATLVQARLQGATAAQT
ncbi:pentapeptide repeat-containing protein, partial [Sediminimonas sp.]|uniref:pentapeptide repeat-containing protein n=1 Tax=Sediminimonas sp. TaxID=2823379 RepID=UPI0025D52028